MLDKYKDENEFYSLVSIKCYSYVPSLLLDYESHPGIKGQVAV